MKSILVVYATREGHTRHVAEHVAAALRLRDLPSTVVDAAHLPAGFSLDRYAAAVLAASVHVGKHEREMVNFVKTYRAELDRLPTAFLSVSMAEGTAEDPTVTAAQHAQAVAEVQEAIGVFRAETGWNPSRLLPVGGALLYRQYGVIKRFLIRMIAKNKGAPTDTSRDWVLTDWEALDQFVGEIAAGLPDPLQVAAAPPPV
jgi:menaquinone-dependent protoporphyrinogen oxidase